VQNKNDYDKKKKEKKEKENILCHKKMKGTTKHLQAITSCVNHHHAKIQFLTFQTLKWP
jgi:hypothetical protein